MLKWIFLVFISISFTITAYAYDFKTDELRSISCLSEIILARFPPSDFAIVGLGRSPTPLTSYMKLDHEGSVWNLPLSNFRYGQDKPSLSGLEKKILYKHFDNYFPSDSDLNGKDIVLLDYCLSGGSLKAAENYLKKYLINRHRTAKIKPLCISDSTTTSNLVTNKINIDILNYGNGTTLDNNLFSHGYDKYAEFGSFDIKLNHNEVRSNTEHKSFLKSLSQTKMMYDPIIQDCKEKAIDYEVQNQTTLMLGQISASSKILNMNPIYYQCVECMERDKIAKIVREAALANQKRIRTRDIKNKIIKSAD